MDYSRAYPGSAGDAQSAQRLGRRRCLCQHVPAALPTALAVGALDDAGQPMESSNWGEAYRENGIDIHYQSKVTGLDVGRKNITVEGVGEVGWDRDVPLAGQLAGKLLERRGAATAQDQGGAAVG